MKFSQLVPQTVCDNLWKFHANRTTDDRVIKVLGSDDFTRCKDFIHVYCSKTCKTSSVMCRTLKWSFKHGNSFPTFVYVCIHFIHGANLIDNVWCLSTHPNGHTGGSFGVSIDIQGVTWGAHGHTGGWVGASMDIQGGHLGCPWTYRGSFGVSMDIQGGHLGCPWTLGWVVEVLKIQKWIYFHCTVIFLCPDIY